MQTCRSKKLNMVIATKTGDSGITGTINGHRLLKSDSRFDTVGEIDELSSFIGLAKVNIPTNHAAYKDLLTTIQKSFFGLMGELTCEEGEVIPYIRKYGSITQEDLDLLDGEVDFLQNIPEIQIKDWIIYGNTDLGSQLDICSKVCRRAERSLIKLNGERRQRSILLKYINRLSDLLFLLARYYDFYLKD